MDVTPISNPSIWAEVGGLNGLVIFALFAVLYVYAKVLVTMVTNHANNVSTILNNHRNDLTKLMDLHAKEREEWGRIVDTRQQETNSTIKGMTAALNRMALRHRNEDHLLNDE